MENGQMILIYLAISLLLLLIINRIVGSKKKKKGIITDAIVVNVDVVRDKETGIVSYFPYVEYMGVDNRVHKALLNSNINPLIGKCIKIQYNPVNYDYAILISQEEE